MSINLNKEIIIPWIMRKLGNPFLKNLNLSDEQIKDCINEANEFSSYYVNNHGVHRTYAYEWAKNVALALCKKQVGMNSLLYKNVTLPGGVKTNNYSYIKLADREMRELNKEIRKEFRVLKSTINI